MNSHDTSYNNSPVTGSTLPPLVTGSHDNSYHSSPVNQHPGTTQSPFDSVFDDNAYPMHPNQRPAQGMNSGDISQQGYYHQDTSYNGAAAVGASPSPQRQHSYGQEDIPLQDRVNKDAEMNDHIYDAPGGAHGRNRDNRGKVRLGELGMFGSDKKRIPWVVYIFTLAQVGVFIGEIVRNGKSSPLTRLF